ncbi:hypothetical protein [Mycobacterium talmoniae]|nr:MULTISPECIES: hypothetical protein [Mycobacterium]
MSAMTAAQQGVFSAITGAFSVITPAQLSGFATAVGPIGVANMIPAFFEATSNNVTSGMLSAVNNSLLGAGTQAAQSAFVKLDEAPTNAAGNLASNFGSSSGAPADNAAPGDVV